MNDTHDIKNIGLNTGEVSELFNLYINNSASICVLSYFAEKAQDPDVYLVIQQSLDLSKKVKKQITDIFNSVNHPIPKGFTNEDVEIKSDKLYSDVFMLTYVRSMCRFGLTQYSEIRASCTRSDVRNFINEALSTIQEIFNVADDMMLNKGIFVKPPYIPVPDKIDFVEKQSFLNGFFGEKRSLNAAEINRLYLNYQRNSLGNAFITGLIQTTENKEVKEYLIRGNDLAEKHMRVSGSFLEKENLPIPASLQCEVTASTQKVFSDKLIIYHITALTALGLASNGTSLSRVMRHDISLAITRLMSEIALYAEDGFNLMINNKWFERMPEAVDRKELANI